MRATVGKAVSITGVIAAAVLALAACTSGSTSSSQAESFAATSAAAGAPAEAGMPARDAAAGAADATAGAAGGGEAEMGAAVDPAAPLPPEQLAADQLAAAQSAGAVVDGSKVIKTANLSVKLTVEPVPETDDAAADREANAAARAAAISQAGITVRGIATTAGGFQSSADGGGSTMAITVRVPAEQYDGVIDKLVALGELTNRTETSQDVTAEIVDVNSRVESMTASVARVRALLAEATDIADVIAIESELAVREANLESLQQQQSALAGQVALSTVSVTLTAVTQDAAPTEPVAQESGFLAGLQSGWAALLGFLSWIGGALGAVLPFLPLVAAAFLLVWWLIRLRRRSRRNPTEPPSGGPAPTPPAPAGPPPAGPTPDERQDALTPTS
jgi:polyhydroxyalkanoate synthesis regulator phasin